jgi:hypothetical protein
MSTGIGAGIAGKVFDQNPGGGTPPVFSNLYSMHFDGINQSLWGSSVPLLGNAGTGNWSVSFWIKVDNMTAGTNQRLFSFGAGGTLQTQMYITTAGSLQIGGAWSDGYGWGAVAGTWYHVIYRVDTSITTLNVGYVLDGSTFNNTNRTITNTFDTTGNFYIGRNSGSYGFAGNIDDFAVWNKYLTDADCLEVYGGGSGVDLNNITPSPNLKNWWRMGDPTGTSTFPNIWDNSGSINMTMTNMTSANIELDVP